MKNVGSTIIAVLFIAVFVIVSVLSIVCGIGGRSKK